MKKLFLIPVMLCAFIMTACGQKDVAFADNSTAINEINTIEKAYSNDDKVSPEIKKLKAEFLKEIKQQYFIDRDLKVPSSLEIILMSKVTSTIYVYFTFDGKMSGARKTSYGKISAPGGFIKKINNMHKDPKRVIYQK